MVRWRWRATSTRSARYDEALAMLNDVRQQESANPINLRSIEQYRSLCLLALGRGAEAEAAIAVVVASDPLYQPTETEASPRVRTAFSEVRQRQLPDIARTRYASAKAVVRPQGLSRPPSSSSASCFVSSTIPTWAAGSATCACW